MVKAWGSSCRGFHDDQGSNPEFSSGSSCTCVTYGYQGLCVCVRACVRGGVCACVGVCLTDPDSFIRIFDHFFLP